MRNRFGYLLFAGFVCFLFVVSEGVIHTSFPCLFDEGRQPVTYSPTSGLAGSGDFAGRCLKMEPLILRDGKIFGGDFCLQGKGGIWKMSWDCSYLVQVVLAVRMVLQRDFYMDFPSVFYGQGGYV